MFKLIPILVALVAGSAYAESYIIGTGGAGGSYERIGNILAGNITGSEVHNSTGSVANIDCLNSGKCQMILAQADALNVYTPTVPFKAKTAYPEFVWWIYNTKLGYSDLEDIEGKKKLRLAVVEGSGAYITLQSFVSSDKGYTSNYESAILTEDLYDAADLVCEGGKTVGLLYVGKSLPNEIKQDFSSCLSVGQATDGDFNDAVDTNGDKLYTKCSIPSVTYRPLKGSSWSDEDTVCVNSMVVYRTDVGDRSQIKRAVNKSVRVML